MAKNYRLGQLTLLGMAVVLTGCGSMRSYQGEMKNTLSSANQGQLDQALVNLEKHNDSQDKDLLYHLEKGELLRLQGNLSASVDDWLKADEKVRVWEDESRVTMKKAAEAVGSVIVNDKLRRYDGQDYEKVMLSTMLTLNHAQLGNLSNARTEIKKTYEREALIASVHEKEYDKVEEDAKKNNVQSTFKDLKGYPVETLDDPEVLKLKNGYQSAFSHYLAGFIFESLREPSLAAAGYRKAIELRPNDALLEQGLRGLDERVRRPSNDTDVLFVVESGFAPARNSQVIPLPVFWKGSFIYSQIAFPVIQPANSYQPTSLTVDGKALSLSAVANLDAMARRALRDEMPGIIVRSSIRALAKGAAQKELTDQLGALGGLAGIAATALTEQADERTWRTLPAQISVGRANFKPGNYTVTVKTPSGPQKVTLAISGRHMIVPLRLLDQTVLAPQNSKTTLTTAQN